MSASGVFSNAEQRTRLTKTPAPNRPELDKLMADAKPPEPFQLQPQDALTPRVIGDWLIRAAKLGVNNEKLGKAAEHRNAVIRWQKANPDKVKVPD